MIIAILLSIVSSQTPPVLSHKNDRSGQINLVLTLQSLMTILESKLELKEQFIMIGQTNNIDLIEIMELEIDIVAQFICLEILHVNIL